MSTKFFTNETSNSLYEKFEGVFSNNPNIHCFDVLVGYFRASGYFKIKDFLSRIPKVRILVGINVDSLIAGAQAKGLQFFNSDTQTREEFMRQTINDIQESNYDEETEKGILQLISDIISNRIEIRASVEKKIHAKIYIFRGEKFNPHTPASVITGSSNLTGRGLGTGNDYNYEFNVLLNDYDDVKFAYDEFERLWERAIPILNIDAETLKKNSFLNDAYTPFEIYIKLLIEYFGKRIEYDPYKIDFMLPDKYRKLKYQSDAANHGYYVMMKHNGFLLADVVGLGKTIIACMVIKKFIFENGMHTKILVVCPPAIQNNWLRTAKDFQIENNIKVLSLGKLEEIINPEKLGVGNAEDFDIIVVDESHKFRNDYTLMYQQLQLICKIPRKYADGSGDIRKKVILISATPLNNRPEDIENQLYLFQDKRFSTLENIPNRNLQDYFKPINEKYKKLASEPELNINKLKTLFNKLRNDIIEPLAIRRTRADIEKNPDYLQDLQSQGITFPKGGDPIELEYILDNKLAQLFFNTINVITGEDEHGNAIDPRIDYYRYRAIEYLKHKKDRDQYGNVTSISDRLAHIMRILLVKRLESSFTAFKHSLSRLSKAYANMIQMFKDDTVFIAPDLDINKLLEDGKTYEEIEEKITAKGNNNKKYRASDFKDEFLALLIADKKIVDGLLEKWQKIQIDPKLEEFKRHIKNTFFSKKRSVEGKLVIFTESKDTANELESVLIAAKKKTLNVSSANRKHLEADIRRNFDANLEEEEWLNHYEVIITTEVLAEGINLHRSNIIVNYDTPWNATRLMQRIGRINRIGSRAESYYVYNFYPSAEGDAEINLVSTAIRKLQAFHTAFGEDNKVFSALEEVGSVNITGTSIQQEESEVQKFLTELREFRKNNPKHFQKIKNMPLRSRAGRNIMKIDPAAIPAYDRDIPERYNLALASATFVKSDNHPGQFYLVNEANNIHELNFLEAAKLFKAAEGEEPIALHSLHHDQVNAAMQSFEATKQRLSDTTISRTQLSNVENKAITTLSLYVKHAPSEPQKRILRQTIDIIKSGAFASRSLPQEIISFHDQHANELANDKLTFFNKLFNQILDKYDISAYIKASDIHSVKPDVTHITNPAIVLSLSFNQ